MINRLNIFSSVCLTENTNAPNDSGIRPKEARCENRTVRHGSSQVSEKTWFTKPTRTNGSTIVEQFTICYHDQSSPLLSCQTQMLRAQANVSDNPRIIYCALYRIYVYSLILCAL